MCFLLVVMLSKFFSLISISSLTIHVSKRKIVIMQSLSPDENRFQLLHIKADLLSQYQQLTISLWLHQLIPSFELYLAITGSIGVKLLVIKRYLIRCTEF